MTRTAVYYRVSTDKQDLDMQQHAVGQWLAARPQYAQARVFSDEGISGSKGADKRPGYAALLAAIAAGEVDTVVVYRLDRLSRDAVSVMKVLLDWIGRGMEFFAVDQPILQLGKANPMRLTICAVFSEIAQIERETTVARVKAGLAAARARGVKLGKAPKIGPDKRQTVAALLSAGASYREVATELGVSASSVHRAMRRE